MRIPLEWLKEYVDLKNAPVKKTAASFTAIGLMLDKASTGI